VTRRIRRIAVISWLGGAASVLPFATDWLDLSIRASNLLLFSAVVSSFVFGLAIGAFSTLQRWIARLGGPPEQPAHAFVLVAVVAGAGVAVMLTAATIVAAL
jgi:hypothetical protein